MLENWTDWLVYLALGVVLAAFFSWLGGVPLRFGWRNVANGLIFAVAFVLLRLVGLGSEVLVACYVIAALLAIAWRRLRPQPG